MRWGFKGVLSVWLGMGDRHWACFFVELLEEEFVVECWGRGRKMSLL